MMIDYFNEAKFLISEKNFLRVRLKSCGHFIIVILLVHLLFFF